MTTTPEDSFYWSIATLAAQASPVTDRQAGAVLVAASGMISVGWNVPVKRTSSYQSAAATAVARMAKSGTSTLCSVLYLMDDLTEEDAKELCRYGIKRIYYDGESFGNATAVLTTYGTRVLPRPVPEIPVMPVGFPLAPYI